VRDFVWTLKTMKKNTKSTTKGHTCPFVIMLMIVLYLNVMKKNTKSTTRFLKKENNKNIMTYEHGICTRCTRKDFTMVFGTIQYCKACFDTVSNDLETKDTIQKLREIYGTN